MIDRERRKNPRVWEDLADLYKCVLAIENRKGMKRQEDLLDFLGFEAEQFRPGGSAEE